MLARHRRASTPGVVAGDITGRRLDDPDRYPGDPFHTPDRGDVAEPAGEPAVEAKRPARRKPAAATS